MSSRHTAAAEEDTERMSSRHSLRVRLSPILSRAVAASASMPVRSSVVASSCWGRCWEANIRAVACSLSPGAEPIPRSFLQMTRDWLEDCLRDLSRSIWVLPGEAPTMMRSAASCTHTRDTALGTLLVSLRSVARSWVKFSNSARGGGAKCRGDALIGCHSTRRPVNNQSQASTCSSCTTLWAALPSPGTERATDWLSSWLAELHWATNFCGDKSSLPQTSLSPVYPENR